MTDASHEISDDSEEPDGIVPSASDGDTAAQRENAWPDDEDDGPVPDAERTVPTDDEPE
jgi:hypothetical protein